MRVLVTGSSGVGKTTIVRKVISRLAGRVGGFYTEEILEDGKRVGFKMRTVSGKTGVLAHKRGEGTYFVKDERTDYMINLKDLDEVGTASVLDAVSNADVIAVDEVGRMQLFSDSFRESIEKAFDSGKPLVASVSKYGGPFEESLKQRDGVILLQATTDNRNALVDEVLAHI